MATRQKAVKAAMPAVPAWVEPPTEDLGMQYHEVPTEVVPPTQQLDDDGGHSLDISSARAQPQYLEDWLKLGNKVAQAGQKAKAKGAAAAMSQELEPTQEIEPTQELAWAPPPPPARTAARRNPVPQASPASVAPSDGLGSNSVVYRRRHPRQRLRFAGSEAKARRPAPAARSAPGPNGTSEEEGNGIVPTQDLPPSPEVQAPSLKRTLATLNVGLPPRPQRLSFTELVQRGLHLREQSAPAPAAAAPPGGLKEEASPAAAEGEDGEPPAAQPEPKRRRTSGTGDGEAEEDGGEGAAEDAAQPRAIEDAEAMQVDAADIWDGVADRIDAGAEASARAPAKAEDEGSAEAVGNAVVAQAAGVPNSLGKTDEALPGLPALRTDEPNSGTADSQEDASITLMRALLRRGAREDEVAKLVRGLLPRPACAPTAKLEDKEPLKAAGKRTATNKGVMVDSKMSTHIAKRLAAIEHSLSRLRDHGVAVYAAIPALGGQDVMQSAMHMHKHAPNNVELVNNGLERIAVVEQSIRELEEQEECMRMGLAKVVSKRIGEVEESIRRLQERKEAIVGVLEALQALV